MRIVFSDGEGFGHYSYPILCELAKDSRYHTIYLTYKNNPYVKKIGKNITVYECYLCCDSSIRKKYSVEWFLNRLYVFVHNSMVRVDMLKRLRPALALVQALNTRFDVHSVDRMQRYCPVIYTVHDVVLQTKTWTYSKRSAKIMYQKLRHLYVHSETNKRQLMEIFQVEEEKIKVIPMGIMQNNKILDREACLRKLGITGGGKKILFYGNIRESKGLDILIKALAGLNCQLIIAGAMPYGENFKKYQDLLDETKLDCVLFIHFTSDEFRDILFQACDIVALPYKFFYSQSGPFLQAIQYHKPILATDVSSFREFIERYQIGKVCVPVHVESLREAALELLSEDLSQYEEKFRRAIEENSYQEMERKLSQYIGEICGGA